VPNDAERDPRCCRKALSGSNVLTIAIQTPTSADVLRKLLFGVE